MTICKITGYACSCQPDEGMECNGIETLRKGFEEWKAESIRLKSQLARAVELLNAVLEFGQSWHPPKGFFKDIDTFLASHSKGGTDGGL